MRFLSKLLVGVTMLASVQVSIFAALTPSQNAIKTYLGGLNFASGGAESGAIFNGPKQTSPPAILSAFNNAGGALPWSLPDQLAQADKLYAQTPFHPQALYAIWIGANDYLAGNQNPQISAAAIVNAVAKMINSYGATNLLIGLLPDLSLTPSSNKLPAEVRAQISQLIMGHNQLVQGGITQLINSLKTSKPTLTIRVAYLDSAATMKRIMTNPKANGFTNIVDACFNQATGAVCSNPFQHLFWDTVHPTVTAHRYLADDAAKALKNAGITSIPQWFVFGDSLSDPGNNYLTGLSFSPQQKFPAKPYWLGHYSNGITWAEQLTLRLLLLQTPIALTLAIPGVKAIATWKSGINFASGGAQSGAAVPGPKQSTNPTVLAAYRAQNSPLPWSLPEELAQADKYYTQQAFHPQALYALWIGANDYLSGNQDPRISAAAIVTAIQHMVTKYNGRQFLIGLLPDLSILPYNAPQPAPIKQALVQLTAGHNALARGEIAQLQSTLASSGINIKIAYLDSNATLYRAFANPSALGFTNTKDACFNKNTGTLCDNSNAYLFFDDVHPSTRGHQELASDAAKALTAAGIINIPQWFMFGDSLSDPGNNLIMGQSLPSPISFPPVPYSEGHFSNGPAFAECLSAIINEYPSAFTDELTPVANYLTNAAKVNVYAVADNGELVAPEDVSTSSTDSTITHIIIAAVASAAGTAILIGAILFILHNRKREMSSLLKTNVRVEGEQPMTMNPVMSMVQNHNHVMFMS